MRSILQAKLWAPVAAVLAAALSVCAHADCVTGAKMMTSYEIPDPNTIVLSNGSQTIVIKTFQFMYDTGRVIVLKDSFCSFANSVLLVGDQVVNAQEVTSSQ